MCIIRSEGDPRDEQELNVDSFISDINGSAGDLREAMETVMESFTDEEILLAGKDKESFCEVAMLRLRTEVLERATEQAKWRRE